MSSSEPQLPKPQPEQEEEEDESSKPQSKKAAKKEAAKLEKLKRRQEAAVASGVQSISMEDPLADNYGDVPLLELQSKVAPGTRVWTEIGKLAEPLKDQYVLVRGRAQRIRAKGKTAFVVLRERGFTVQCVLTEQDGFVSRPMLKYAAGLSRESIVDVEGVVSVPGITINSTTQQVSTSIPSQLFICIYSMNMWMYGEIVSCLNTICYVAIYESKFEWLQFPKCWNINYINGLILNKGDMVGFR